MSVPMRVDDGTIGIAMQIYDTILKIAFKHFPIKCFEASVFKTPFLYSSDDELTELW